MPVGRKPPDSSTMPWSHMSRCGSGGLLGHLYGRRVLGIRLEAVGMSKLYCSFALPTTHDKTLRFVTMRTNSEHVLKSQVS